MCTALLPTDVKPFTINKYIISIRSATPLIHGLGNRWRCVQYHMSVGLPPVRTPAPTKQEAGFATDQGWTFCRTKFSLATARIRPSSGPARSLVTIPLMPSAVLNRLFGSGLGDRRTWRTGGMIFDRGKKISVSVSLCSLKSPHGFTLGLNLDTALVSRWLIAWKSRQTDQSNSNSFSGKLLHSRYCEHIPNVMGCRIACGLSRVLPCITQFSVLFCSRRGYFKIYKNVTVMLMLAGDLAIRNTQTQQLYRPHCLCKWYRPSTGFSDSRCVSKAGNVSQA